MAALLSLPATGRVLDRKSSSRLGAIATTPNVPVLRTVRVARRAVPRAGRASISASASASPQPFMDHPVTKYVVRTDSSRNLASSYTFMAVRFILGAIFYAAFCEGHVAKAFAAFGHALAPGHHAVSLRMDWFFAAFVVMTVRQVYYSLFVATFNFRMLPSMMIAFGVPCALAAFAAVAYTSTLPFGLIDAIGVALFLIGSTVESLSEIQRKAFKADPANSGKLFYGGLFSLAQHINYTGEILWYAGLALLTRNVGLAVIFPIIMTSFFYFVSIPEIQTHLRTKYGTQWAAKQASGDKLLIPFVL